MVKRKGFKHTIQVKKSVRVEDILQLMSNEEEKGIIHTKSVSGLNRICVYSLHPDMEFNQIGDVIEVEKITLYTATDYDDLSPANQKMLYGDEDDKIVIITIE